MCLVKRCLKYLFDVGVWGIALIIALYISLEFSFSSLSKLFFFIMIQK